MAAKYAGPCVTCLTDLFLEDLPGCVAYRLGLPAPDLASRHLELVDLKGGLPYSGVRLLCPRCLEFFAGIVVDRPRG